MLRRILIATFKYIFSTFAFASIHLIYTIIQFRLAIHTQCRRTMDWQKKNSLATRWVCIVWRLFWRVVVWRLHKSQAEKQTCSTSAGGSVWFVSQIDVANWLANLSPASSHSPPDRRADSFFCSFFVPKLVVDRLWSMWSVVCALDLHKCTLSTSYFWRKFNSMVARWPNWWTNHIFNEISVRQESLGLTNDVSTWHTAVNL